MPFISLDLYNGSERVALSANVGPSFETACVAPVSPFCVLHPSVGT